MTVDDNVIPFVPRTREHQEWVESRKDTEDFKKRVERLKSSMDRINELMEELRDAGVKKRRNSWEEPK